MAGILPSNGNHAIDSNATNAQWTPEVLKQLKVAGIDLDAMGAKTWGYTKDANGKSFLFWTNADITNLNNNDIVPAIRYNCQTKTYTVWYYKVETKGSGSDTYNSLVYTNKDYQSSTTNEQHQTYANALKHLEDAQNSKN